MLGDIEALATIGVKDVEAATQFYGKTLGLKALPSKESGVLSFKSGNSVILVYKSQFAGTNKATAVTWNVGEELDEIVKALKAKGVVFEHYDFPSMTRKGEIHAAGNTRVAWLKDPDGNILALVSDQK